MSKSVAKAEMPPHKVMMAQQAARSPKRFIAFSSTSSPYSQNLSFEATASLLAEEVNASAPELGLLPTLGHDQRFLVNKVQ
jgi:hypothetical protein